MVQNIPDGTRVPPLPVIGCGDTVKYICKSGYALEGEQVLTCGLDGNFDYDAPRCTGEAESDGELCLFSNCMGRPRCAQCE